MKLITLLVVIAGVIALAQLAKVGQLTSLIRNKKEEDISEADSRLNGGLFIAFMAAGFVAQWPMVLALWQSPFLLGHSRNREDA